MEPTVGQIRTLGDGRKVVFGPDPWADRAHGDWNCWFSLDQYRKDFGKDPPYLPEPPKE